MQKIYKYNLTISPEQEIEANIVKVLDIQVQRDSLYMWAIVDEDPNNLTKRTAKIYCLYTGDSKYNQLSKLNLNFICTLQYEDLVLHWFYR